MPACNPRHILMPLTVCAVIFGAAPLFAQSKKVAIHSGTGFFISPEYVITNEHVLHNGCKEIIIQDRAKDWAVAQIVAVDEVHDLALIRTPKWPRDYATLRSSSDELQVGENLVAIGYPETTLKNGKDYEVVGAKILNPKESFGENWLLQFTHIIKQGYSGGPLLDTTGKVVGVVKDFAMMYESETVDGKIVGDKTLKGTIDEAINVKTLEQFLIANHILYHSVQKQEKTGGLDFTINVQCVQRD